MQNRNIFLLIFIAILSFFSCSKKNDEKLSSTNSGSIVENHDFNMIFVEGGDYIMFSSKVFDEFRKDKTLVKVYISSFKMSSTEITQGLYKEIMGKNPSEFAVNDNYPVDSVTWFNAIEFCNKLSERDGLEKCYLINEEDVNCNFTANGYRLPTDAEWEFAASGGLKTHGFKYSGSNTFSEVSNACSDRNQGYPSSEVAKFKPNELGFYDMSGNLWEWCWDKYEFYWDFTYYPEIEKKDPKGPDNRYGEINERTLKGSDMINCGPLDSRTCCEPDKTTASYGFRICQSITE